MKDETSGLNGGGGLPEGFLRPKDPIGPLSPQTLIYCEECGQHQPLCIALMIRDEANDNNAWGDLLCGVCGLVIATLQVPEEGRYEFVKVRDVA